MTGSGFNRKHVIVIGGGFAGLNFSRQLFKNKYYKITLVDRNNYNFFTPLLYQVATGFLEPSSISYPFRKFLRNSDITFRNAELTRVDPVLNKVYLSDGPGVDYDFLVFAAGTKTNVFGNESIRKNAFVLKGIEDALLMRNEMIQILERASIEQDPLVRRKMLTIAIAGGGATGVELAGMFAEMKTHIIRVDYPELQNELVEIHLIDAAPHLLPSMSKRSRWDAYSVLSRLGVHIHLNTLVDQFDGDTVKLSNGGDISTATLIWCAGVMANVFEGISMQSLGKGMRMVTNEFSMVKGYDNIFAIGDICLQTGDSKYPGGHPQVAQPAIQQGNALAKNLVLLAIGRSMKPFKYVDKGSMAIVGRNFAVADLLSNSIHVNGILGLLAWLFIHLISLVNYNNKIKTLYNWLVAYLTYDQVLRMVFTSNKESSEPETKSQAANA